MLDGKDYYSALAPYLLSFSYTDNSDGKKADDLSFDLADRDKKFISTWMPKKGASLEARIIAERWFAPYTGSLSLDCGKFWIDSIEFSLPDHTVSVKATSIPTDARIKASDETRGWENTTLQDIANQIAGENQMSVDWQADQNPRYKRTEQHGESSLAFLMKRAKDAKLAIKVHKGKIVIFDEQKLEEAAPAFTLLYGDTGMTTSMGACYRMTGGHFVTKITDTTKKAKVSHTNPETGDTGSGEWTDPDGDLIEEHDDKINDDPDTDSDSGDGDGDGIGDPSLRAGEEGAVSDWNAEDSGAALKAKSHVRDKNKEKETADIEMSIGNPLIASGQTFTLQGVGQYDGKWFAVSVHHTVGPQYKTQVTARRCLTGY